MDPLGKVYLGAQLEMSTSSTPDSVELTIHTVCLGRIGILWHILLRSGSSIDSIGVCGDPCIFVALLVKSGFSGYVSAFGRFWTACEFFMKWQKWSTMIRNRFAM